MATRILVIEDEIWMATLIKKRLENANYEVQVENDGQTGLDTARQTSPDLILLDVMLPKLDGYKICRLLKFDDKYKTIPIIMFTALDQEGDIATAKSVGADGYLTKPFESQDLMKKIEELLKK
ncbi:MAG: response regulator [Chlamydiae bacterium]|nr:response regulator [Chlamydiota bacterium]MBI3266605.1 response regulator [Chlamydiota bacterium]